MEEKLPYFVSWHTLRPYLLLLRPMHWSKSAFVFLGVIYAAQLSCLPDAIGAAIAFCCLASAVYIYNDIEDLDEDRLHPNRCRRPLTNDEISVYPAFGILAFLLVFGLGLGFLISSLLAALLAIYLMLNVLYNHFLKPVPVMDVACIASGFMLRVLAGTVGIGLPASIWLVLSATVLSLFIALCKRRLEKKLTMGYETRRVLKRYSLPVLDFLIKCSAGFCLIIYILYLNAVHPHSYYFLMTIPFVAIGLIRFIWLGLRDSDIDDPVTLFFQDKLSCFNLICFLLLTMIALINI